MTAKDIIRRSAALRSALFAPIALRRMYLRLRRQHADEAIDRLCMIACGDVTLRIDEFGGLFSLNPRSDLFRRFIIDGCYEPKLVEVFRRYVDPERDIIDIGANVGFYSVLGAKLTQGRVMAVEPTSAAAKRLRANLELNGVAHRVSIFEGLISDNIGTGLINIVQGKEEYSSIGSLVHPAIAGEASVQRSAPCNTLDELVSGEGLNAGFVKIDVEGAEALVLAGATQVLITQRPVVLSEISNALLRRMGASGPEIVALFKRHGYQVTDPIDPRAPPGTAEFGDILCVPEERV